MVSTVRRELQHLMPGVSYVSVTPLEKILEPNVRPWRLGGGIALLAGKFIAPLLYRVSPKDPLIYVLAAATLLAVAILASLLPVLRATRVDPNVALRAA